MDEVEERRTWQRRTSSHRLQRRLQKIREGANINDKDNYGASSLLYASSQGHVNAAELLLSKGANINDITNEGDTAISLSISDRIKYTFERDKNRPRKFKRAGSMANLGGVVKPVKSINGKARDRRATDTIISNRYNAKNICSTLAMT